MKRVLFGLIALFFASNSWSIEGGVGDCKLGSSTTQTVFSTCFSNAKIKYPTVDSYQYSVTYGYYFCNSKDTWCTPGGAGYFKFTSVDVCDDGYYVIDGGGLVSTSQASIICDRIPPSLPPDLICSELEAPPPNWPVCKPFHPTAAEIAAAAAAAADAAAAANAAQIDLSKVNIGNASAQGSNDAAQAAAQAAASDAAVAATAAQATKSQADANPTIPALATLATEANNQSIVAQAAAAQAKAHATDAQVIAINANQAAADAQANGSSAQQAAADAAAAAASLNASKSQAAADAALATARAAVSAATAAQNALTSALGAISNSLISIANSAAQAAASAASAAQAAQAASSAASSAGAGSGSSGGSGTGTGGAGATGTACSAGAPNCVSGSTGAVCKSTDTDCVIGPTDEPCTGSDCSTGDGESYSAINHRVNPDEYATFGSATVSYYGKIESSPIVTSMNSFKNLIQISSAECPEIRIDWSDTIINRIISTNIHCELFEQNAGVLSLIMHIVFLFAGFRIFAGA